METKKSITFVEAPEELNQVEMSALMGGNNPWDSSTDRSGGGNYRM